MAKFKYGSGETAGEYEYQDYQMEPELKGKWLNALRSGKYTQGTQWLKAYNTFDEGVHHCCLGVLMEVLEVPQERNESKTVVEFYDEDEVCNAMIPNSVRRKAGLSFDTCSTLAYMNDNRGMSFDAIATFIEEKL